jgi:predicted enzyme related to lactoylglutathione lyase
VTDQGEYKHGAFCWHEVATRDAPGAKQFYRDVFGYDLDDQEIPGGGGTYTMLRAGGGDVAGLYEMSGETFEGVPPHWMPYVWVDDVDATAAKAGELGGSIAAEPMDIPGVGRMAVIEDPTGAVISIYHGAEHQGAAHTGAYGTVGWNELMTRDSAAAESFYTALFGWSPRKQDMEGTPYTVFSVDETPAAGMLEMQGPQWEGVPAHWMPYVSVADCQATVDAIGRAGGAVEVPPTEVPGIGTFSVVKDSTGAVFSVMKFLPQQPPV